MIYELKTIKAVCDECHIIEIAQVAKYENYPEGWSRFTHGSHSLEKDVCPPCLKKLQNKHKVEKKGK